MLLCSISLRGVARRAPPARAGVRWMKPRVPAAEPEAVASRSEHVARARDRLRDRRESEGGPARRGPSAVQGKCILYESAGGPAGCRCGESPRVASASRARAGGPSVARVATLVSVAEHR